MIGRPHQERSPSSRTDEPGRAESLEETLEILRTRLPGGTSRQPNRDRRRDAVDVDELRVGYLNR